MKTRNLLLFLLGALGYGGIELLWRGRTHGAMLLAGGICFLLFVRLEERHSHLPRLYRVVLAALSVTAVELVFGVVCNLLLGWHVWDYSRVPLNFLGQICLPYTVAWGFLASIFLPFARYMARKLPQKT